MYSAIGFAVFNAIFMGVTMWWGAKYSLDCKNPRSGWGLMMPVILMLPRFFLAIASVVIGMTALEWDRTSAGWFVGLLLGLWVLIMTGEVIYVQHRLSRRREESEIDRLQRRVKDLENENKEVAKDTCEQISVPGVKRGHHALISYQTRKTLRFRKV